MRRNRSTTAIPTRRPLLALALVLLGALALAGTAHGEAIAYLHTAATWPQQHTNGSAYAVMDAAPGQVIDGVVTPDPPPDALTPSSIRFEVRPGDKWRGSTGERAQLATDRSPFVETEGTDRWYSDWIYAPSCCWPIRPTFMIPIQNHSDAVQAEVQWDFRNTLQLFAPDPITGAFGDPLGDFGRTLDTWHFLLWHVHYSSDPTAGLIEAWVDGVPTLRHVGQTLLTPTDTSYQLIGIYRDDSPTLPDGTPAGATDVIFHNGYTMYDADPRRVTVTPRAVTVPVNGTAAFAADVRAGFGPTAWSASCGTIDADGNYTAPADPGTCTVTASNGGISDQVTVTVVATTVAVAPPAATVRAGEVATFLATVANPLGPTVWTASGGTVDAAGTFTAGHVPGAYTVTATNNGVVGQAAVTVVPWLGTDAVGTAGWNAASTGVKRCTVFTDAGGGSARGLVVHYRGSSQVTGSATLRGVIYTAPDGQPGALVESTVARTVNAGDAARWATLPWSDGGLATLVDGRSYCLGFVATGDPWVIEYPFDVAADAQFANANPDDNPPSDPFGPASGFDVRESVYVDFSPTAMAVPFRRVARSPSPTAVRATRTPPRPAVRALAARRDIAPKRVTFRRDRRVGRVAR